MVVGALLVLGCSLQLGWEAESFLNKRWWPSGDIAHGGALGWSLISSCIPMTGLGLYSSEGDPGA